MKNENSKTIWDLSSSECQLEKKNRKLLRKLYSVGLESDGKTMGNGHNVLYTTSDHTNVDNN